MAITALRNSRNGVYEALVGEMNGFKIGVHSHPFDDFPNFFFEGDGARHSARAMKSGNGIIEALLSTYRASSARLNSAEERLALQERKLAGLLTQIGAPFEYQDRMDEVLARQQQIDAALGLHKDNAGAVDAEEAMPMAA